MADMTNIGINALLAYKTALTLTSDNIANANNPYYSRRMIDFDTAPSGSGVRIADVRRIVDDQANRYAQSANSDFSKASIYLQQLKNFEPLLDNDSTSIKKYIADSLDALVSLSASPSSPQNRNLYISKLNSMVQRFQDVDGQIVAEQQNTNHAMQTGTTQASQLLGVIASLNDQIANTTPENQTPLLDQRDGIVQQLSQYLNFNVSTDENGIMNLSMGNGMPLVMGNRAVTLSTTTDPADSSSLLIMLQNGPNTFMVTSGIQSGQLAGLINYKNNVLDVTRNAIGRLSLAIADSLNIQNRLGIDGKGNFGGDIFNDINSAAAAGNRVSANSQNTGSSNMGVRITDLSALTTNDYKLVIGSANSYVLKRVSDNSIASSGTISASLPQTITVDGFSLDINSGTFNAGDQYLISPTKGASASMTVLMTDPTLLALGWPVNADPATTNKGQGKIDVSAITDPSNAAFATPKALTPPLIIQFIDSTHYNVIDQTNNTTIAGPVSYDPNAINTIIPSGAYDPGYTVTLSGSIVAGDQFNITYNADSTSDHRNATAMFKLYDNGLLQGGTVSLTNAYNILATDVSIMTQTGQTDYDSKSALKNKADDSRDSISGVSIEEETLNLARYQQAYQASAQILQVAKSVFDIIIGMARS
jgi:flagellar hook-associated protein 1